VKRACIDCGLPIDSSAKFSRCDRHAATVPKHRQSPRSAGAYDRDYRAKRQKILATNPVCVLCLKAPATTLDHVIPLHRGGTNDWDNLRPACRSCNSRRGALEQHRRPVPFA